MKFRKSKLLSRITVFIILFIFLFDALMLGSSISGATTNDEESISTDEAATDNDDTSTDDDTSDEDTSTDEESTEYVVTTEYPDEPGREPDLVSNSAIVIDASSGTILYEKNAYEQHYPASITKLMTCLLAIENSELNETVTMSYDAIWGIDRGSNHIALDVGEEISMQDALYALMLESANEVAWGIGEHIANGSISDFADMMTERAEELGCLNTHFTNANGLPDDDHYTTCYDMALITMECLKYDTFRKITGTLNYTIGATNLCDEERSLWHHCRMLYPGSNYYYEYCEGGKTGYTTVAKNTLVTWSKQGDMELICVLMDCNGASNAYTDTKALYNYCYENYSTITPLTDYVFDDEQISEALAYLNNFYGVENDSDITLNVDSTFSLSFKNDEDSGAIEYAVSYLDEPVNENDVFTVGNLVLYYKNKLIGSTEITVTGYDTSASVFTDKSSSATNIADVSAVSDNIDTENSIDMHILFVTLAVTIPVLIVLIFVLYLVHVSKVRKKQRMQAAARRKRYEEHKKRINDTYDTEINL